MINPKSFAQLPGRLALAAMEAVKYWLMARTENWQRLKVIRNIHEISMFPVVMFSTDPPITQSPMVCLVLKVS